MHNKNKIAGGIVMVMIIGAIVFFLFFNENSKGAVTVDYFSFSIEISNQDSSKENTISKFVEEQLEKGKKTNRLINEKSPYLLQHAFNPVNWYPWGEEAFEKARKEDKPIFLSVGYSTCYWCHVMEREVFENNSIAALMNKYVIAIKVDREERPDVDRVYMSALQTMTGSGGWPMSMFLTPDLKPFYGGTYIPAEPKYGRQGFPEVLNSIHNAWINRREEIIKSSNEITSYLKNSSAPNSNPADVGLNTLTAGFESFNSSYDAKNGGFNKAPKFPRPVIFNFLFRYYSRTGNEKALSMSLETLKKMAEGGMYDHIAGGFHRYSTDDIWQVPHFEKMLYDQAQLTTSYLDAYQITHNEFYANVAKDILNYVKNNLTHPEGGFYSAEDAESAVDPSEPEIKEEGAFYTWHYLEIDSILIPEEAKIFNYYFGVKENGNVKSDPHNEFKNENILYAAHSIEETAEKFNLPVVQIKIKLSTAKEKVNKTREQRPRPHLDDKIILSWNGLMLSAFSKAYQVLGNEEYLNTAVNAGNFIINKLYNSKDEILLRRYRDGEARFDAHLEDYAFFIQGLLDLYEASFDIKWLKIAIKLNKQKIKLFYDKDQKAFFDISADDSNIIVRTKEWYDGAEPTGNSIAILNLLRLSQMTANDILNEMAANSLAYFGERMKKAPHVMPQFLAAVDFNLSKPKQIIIAGKSDDPHTKELLQEVHSRFIPNKIILLADGEEGQNTLASYIPFIESIKMIDGKPTAYICENYTCKLPTSDRNTVAKLLNN